MVCTFVTPLQAKVEDLVAARQAVNDKVEGTLQTVGRLSAVLDMHKQELDDVRDFKQRTDDAIVAVRSGAEELARSEAARVGDKCDAVGGHTVAGLMLFWVSTQVLSAVVFYGLVGGTQAEPRFGSSQTKS